VTDHIWGEKTSRRNNRYEDQKCSRCGVIRTRFHDWGPGEYYYRSDYLDEHYLDEYWRDNEPSCDDLMMRRALK
jgi:hypothetical protein